MRKLMLSKYTYLCVSILGALAFFYPLVTSLINLSSQTRVISNYESEMKALAEKEKREIREQAEEYNRFIAGLEGNVTDAITEYESSQTDVIYMSVLSVGESVGYVEIPGIDVKLPIYRGTSDEVLSLGVGHMEKSSFPIGGADTHAVLVAHRGLPTARMFRDLDQLEVGDLFFVNILGETCAYRIESKVIVLPDQAESLQVQTGRDLCTLLTCDPYMINSHRLLVTGERISYGQDSGLSVEKRINLFQKYIEYFAILAAIALVFFLVWVIRRQMRETHGKKLDRHDKNKNDVRVITG
jgi:sortase A